MCKSDHGIKKTCYNYIIIPTQGEQKIKNVYL